MRILEEGREVLSSVRELVLQPQSELAQFRHFLQDNGYHIISESFVMDEDKYYPMMKVIHGDMHYETETEFKYGRILLHEENPILYEYLNKQKKHYVNLLEEIKNIADTERATKRKQEIMDELKQLEEALSYYGSKAVGGEV